MTREVMEPARRYLIEHDNVAVRVSDARRLYAPGPTHVRGQPQPALIQRREVGVENGVVLCWFRCRAMQAGESTMTVVNGKPLTIPPAWTTREPYLRD